MAASKSTSTANTTVRPIKDDEPVIYCLEGIWRHDGESQPVDLRSNEPSVEPILRYLKQADYWDYRHRDVATVSELTYYLENEWQRCQVGSILYLPTHGSPGCITLSHREDVYLTSDLKRNRREGYDLVSLLGPYSKNCHVHFGGCAVMENAEEWSKDFLSKTGVSVVSGFARDEIGWTDLNLPGVLAEIMLFSALSGVNFANQGSFKTRMKRIMKDMNERFPDIGFDYRTR